VRKIKELKRKLFCFDVWLINTKRRKHFPPHCAYGTKEVGENSFSPTPFLFARLLETPSDFFGRRRDLNLDGG